MSNSFEPQAPITFKLASYTPGSSSDPQINTPPLSLDNFSLILGSGGITTTLNAPESSVIYKGDYVLRYVDPSLGTADVSTGTFDFTMKVDIANQTGSITGILSQNDDGGPAPPVVAAGFRDLFAPYGGHPVDFTATVGGLGTDERGNYYTVSDATLQQVVPEPATVAMLISILPIGYIGWRRKRKQAAA